MKCKLSELCDYVQEKVEVSSLSLDNYVSTENMLPNRGLLEKASSLPSMSKVQSFQPGDVLVSNIRPYFKKIWYAEVPGGCSNDVLVFRAKDEVDKRFLYYLLSDDAFFDYSMSTSKGTKMPRGDRKAIMEYTVPKLPYEIQKRISLLLGSLDQKIIINNQLNDNLAAT